MTFLTIEIIQLQARIPLINAKIKPSSSDDWFIFSGMVLRSKAVLVILPKIRGRTIKNENRAAFSRSIPKRIALEMVKPLLEIPGKIAIA